MQVRTRYEKGTFTVVPNVDRLSDLSPKAQALFVWLCFYADSDGICFPSRRILAEKIGINKVASVDKYIKELHDNVFVSILKRKDEDGRNLTNIYQILLAPEKDETWDSRYRSTT